MELLEELLPGAWSMRLRRIEDDRGIFVKTYASSLLDASAQQFDFHEEFYSLSRKDVVRGMHFQVPPHDHIKLVYCPVGAVLDVLLDLRPGPCYGLSASITLSQDDPVLLIIPRGIAHGFRSLVDGSLVVYKTSSEYAPLHDVGVRWDSFGFDWGVELPIVSERDSQHPTLSSFRSPFIEI